MVREYRFSILGTKPTNKKDKLNAKEETKEIREQLHKEIKEALEKINRTRWTNSKGSIYISPYKIVYKSLDHIE